MAEPVGITGTALAVTSLLYSTCKTTCEIVEAFQSAPKEYKDLSKDLRGLQLSSDSLKGTLSNTNDASLSDEEKSALKSLRLPLETCEAACSEFKEKLEEMTRHSTEGHQSFRDRLQLHWKSSEVAWLKDKIAAAKQTLQVALGVCTLGSIIHDKAKLDDFRQETATSMSELTGKVQALMLTVTALPDTLSSLNSNPLVPRSFARDIEVMREQLDKHGAFLKMCLAQHTAAMNAMATVDSTVRVKHAKATERARQVVGNMGDIRSDAPSVVVDTVDASGNAFQGVGNNNFGGMSKEALDFLAGKEN